MKIYDLPAIFSQALLLSATEVNIKSSFRTPGIWPLNRQIFQLIDFMPSDTTDRPFIANSIVSEEPHLTAEEILLSHDQFIKTLKKTKMIAIKKWNRTFHLTR